MNFKSWVPTVTGLLSFTIIGRTDWPRPCISVSRLRSSDPQGAIFVQERFTHDFALPFVNIGARATDFVFRNAGKLFGRPDSGWQYFFCLVDSPEKLDDGEVIELNGQIAVVPYEPTSAKTVSRVVKRVLSMRGTQQISEVSDQIKLDLNGLSPITASFCLRRNGEFGLKVERNTAAIDFEPLSELDLKRYAAQCYYFIRDISHNHQHHEASSDLIVQLHHDQPDWKKLVYFDLFRSVIQFKRVKTEFHITNASGVLAYSETFRELFLKEASIQPYYPQNTLLSLETAKYELQLKQSRRSNYIALAQTLIFGIFGAFIALASLAELASEDQKKRILPSESLVLFTQLVVENPAYTLVSATLIGCLIAIFLGFAQPERRVFFRNTLKIFQSLPRNFSASIFVFVGGCFILGGYALIRFFSP